jgi:predicted DNA-binding ribbon-helix-helix protein
MAKTFSHAATIATRVIVAGGRRTGIPLEPIMGDASCEIARLQNRNIGDIVTAIHERRVYVVKFYSDFAAAILADPEGASYWAENCGWVPGSGYCTKGRTGDCQQPCLFRAMCDKETATIRARARRRPA